MKVLMTLVAGCVLCSGCASTGYLGKRDRDFRDIVTVQVGYGVGAKVRTGPVFTGASWIWTPAGLSNGELYRGAMTEEVCPADVAMLFTGVEYSPRGAQRGKDYRTPWNTVPFIALPEKIGEDTGSVWPHPYYTDFRVSAGLGPAVTLGLNPGEFVDFLLGWFAIDIYGDDEADD